MTLSLFLLTYSDSLPTSSAILWLSNDSLLTSTYSLLTLCWLSTDALLTICWHLLVSRMTRLTRLARGLQLPRIWNYDRLRYASTSKNMNFSNWTLQQVQIPACGEKKHITWVKKKMIVMFVLNLAFVHQCSIHPKYKSLCKYGPSVEGTFSIMMFWTHRLYTKTHYTPKYRMLCLWAPWAHGWGGYMFCWDVLNLTCVCL